MNRTRIAAAFAVLVLAGCGGTAAAQHAPATTPPPPASSPATTPPADPSADPPAPGAAFCAALTASATPQITYENEIIRQVSLASDGGTATDAVLAAQSGPSRVTLVGTAFG